VVTRDDDSKHYDIFLEFDELVNDHELLDLFQEFGAREVDVLAFQDEDTEIMLDSLFRLLEGKRGKMISRSGKFPTSIKNALQKRLELQSESSQRKWFMRW